METLQTKPRNRSRRKRHRSRVRQFYSDFNSDSESEIAGALSEPDFTQNGDIFTFDINEAKAPVLRPDRSFNNGYYYGADDEFSPSSYYGDVSRSRSRSRNRGGEVTELPLSPGLTPNQELKDKAYEIIYQNKIKELKRTAF